MVKRKRVSKKTKHSWRKHVDIKDVENFLEDKRTDERIGSFETVENKDLFVIDTKPEHKKVKGTNKKQRRNNLAKSIPKCFTLLQPLTKVPDPIKKRNRVRTKEERQDEVRVLIEERKRAQGIIKAKERVAKRNREYQKLKKISEAYKIGDVKNDLWEIEDFDPINVPDKQWLVNDTIRHNRQGIGKLRKMVPQTVRKKPSLIPAIEPPHPGTSYNPSFKDHQDLMDKVVQKEQEILKQEQHINRVTNRMFSKTTISNKEASWLTEMSEGLQTEETNHSEQESDSEFKPTNPSSKNMKKDKKQKRKQKEQKELQRQLMLKKLEKKKISDIYRLKKLNISIEKHEKKAKLLREKREKAKELDKFKTKQLGAKKYEEPDLDYNEISDIKGNLRNVKTEGSILTDRFKSMQKRNILQPVTQQKLRKRSKIKRYEPASHKMGWEPKGYKSNDS